MTSDIKVSCRCGKLQGRADISPKTACRAVCYCASCQAFSHFLGCAGEALDANGGTDILLTSPALIEFAAGKAQLAAVRLTEKGPLRWYASCCNTPIGSTARADGVPFFGLLPKLTIESGVVDSAIGAAEGAFFPASAKGDAADLVKGGKSPKSMYAKLALRLLKAKLRGDHKRSAFRDVDTGAPVAQARLLDEAERAALYAKV